MNRTGESVFVCMKCCEMLNITFTGFITSQCNRKYCWLCGWSSDSDLELVKEKTVRKKCKKKSIALKA